MTMKIKWMDDFNEAVERAGLEKKAVLLDFFNPQ